MHLIEKQALSTVFEQNDTQVINQLIKNFSPAELALEAEVLNWLQPVILFFAQREHAAYQKMHEIMEQFAKVYESQIKFTEVDVNELLKVADQFHLAALPALLVMYQRAEIARGEDLNGETFKDELQKLIDMLK